MGGVQKRKKHLPEVLGVSLYQIPVETTKPHWGGFAKKSDVLSAEEGDVRWDSVHFLHVR